MTAPILGSSDAPLIDLQLKLSYAVDAARALPAGSVSDDYVALTDVYIQQIGQAVLAARAGS